jgi:hypothetical protein
MNEFALDQFSLLSVFFGATLAMILFIEIGFRFGIYQKANSVKAQASQVRAIMGALLGLLAFMLAFTFASAQNHFETRIQGMVDETTIAGTAFMQADLLEEPRRTQAKRLLFLYISERLEMDQLSKANHAEGLLKLVKNAENIQDKLWDLAKGSTENTQDPTVQIASSDAFASTVIELTNIQARRIQAALVNRIPQVIWATLFFTALLSMVVMGYQAGLTGKRSPMATLTLAIAFSSVMMLITDLDRPKMTMFDIDDQVVVSLKDRMERDLAAGSE